jgi:hypothetical protein
MLDWVVFPCNRHPLDRKPRPLLRLSQGQALIVVLVLSFGLWAVIWVTVALLVAVAGGGELGRIVGR